MSQSTDLTVFTAPSGGRLRVILKDDEPWFVASDVCAALDIANPRDAVSTLDADEKGVGNTDTPGGIQRKTIVSEPGLYALILRSRKPEAKAFRRWVLHDVLPTIRRSGGYQVAPKPMTPREMALAVIEAEDAKDAALRALASTERNLETTEAIVDRMTASQGCLSFAQAGQTLGMSRPTMIAHCGRLGLVILRPGTSDHLRPYQAQLRAGRFEVEAQQYEHPDNGPQVVSRTRVTPKGLVHIAQKLHAEGVLPPRGRTWLAKKEESR